MGQKLFLRRNKNGIIPRCHKRSKKIRRNGNPKTLHGIEKIENLEEIETAEYVDIIWDRKHKKFRKIEQNRGNIEYLMKFQRKKPAGYVC